VGPRPNRPPRTPRLTVLLPVLFFLALALLLLLLLQSHRHGMPQPRTARTPEEPPRPDPVGPELLQRERGSTEHVPFGTADDGAFHRIHQVPSPSSVDERKHHIRGCTGHGSNRRSVPPRYASTAARDGRIHTPERQPRPEPDSRTERPTKGTRGDGGRGGDHTDRRPEDVRLGSARHGVE
jgi:hypothetical protein